MDTGVIDGAADADGPRHDDCVEVVRAYAAEHLVDVVPVAVEPA